MTPRYAGDVDPFASWLHSGLGCQNECIHSLRTSVIPALKVSRFSTTAAMLQFPQGKHNCSASLSVSMHCRHLTEEKVAGLVMDCNVMI